MFTYAPCNGQNLKLTVFMVPKFQEFSRAKHDSGERVLSHGNVQTGFLRDQLLEAAEERQALGKKAGLKSALLVCALIFGVMSLDAAIQLKIQ